MDALLLMKKLMEVVTVNRNAKVYIYGSDDSPGHTTKDMPVDFSGFSVDDNNEVVLHETCDDKPA